MKQVRFKGGPIWMNSGGQGPDDYLLKSVNGGRWTVVIFRFGRNFRWSPGGKVEDSAQAQANAKEDREMMENIFPVSRVCVPDNAQRYAKMKGRGNVPTMSASEFWAKHKDCPLVRGRW